MKKPLTVETRNILAGLLLGLLSALRAVAADLNVPAQYTTIQTAVNAASSGDTIHIAPGVYAEQILVVHKNLTFAGVPGAVIRAKSGMVNTLIPYEYPGAVEVVALLGVAFSDVTVSGLEFEGEHLASEYSPAALTGIYLISANGLLEHCVVHGFRPADGVSADAWGLSNENYVNRGTPVVTVQVLNSVFADNSTSILLIGDDAPNPVNNATLRTQFALRDNVISGVGPTANGFQTGILISVGCTGEVKRNTISDFYHLNADPNDLSMVSIGVMGDGTGRQTALQPVRYEGNTFVDNQGALLSKLGDGSQFVNNNFLSNQIALFSMLGNGCQFVNNTFQGRGFSRSDTGLAVSGVGAQISGNRFSILGLGVAVIGDDPVFGTSLGIATNATLIGNRFCDTTTPIEIQPLATGTTNQGTLLCPFPPPMLAIAPAVLLTWPAYTAGWILESAPAANGPWTATGLTPIPQGDENTVAVRSDKAHQFFRLRGP